MISQYAVSFLKKHQTKAIILLLAVITISLFGRTANYNFVWDDSLHFNVKNEALHNPDLKNIAQLWKKPYNGLYIPLTYTTWAFINKLGGAGTPFNPRHFHLANILFHTLNVLLVFVILRRLLKHNLSAGFGALLFALHPVQVESVAWASEFKGLLSATFAFIAIWQYLVYSGSQQKVSASEDLTSDPAGRISHNRIQIFHYLIASLAYTMALLSKPSAVIIPFMLLAIDRILLKKTFQESIKILSIWILCSIGIILVTREAQPHDIIDFITPLWGRPFIIAESFSFYLYKLFFPLKLSASYGRTPEWVMGQWWFWISWVIPLVIVVFIWRIRKTYPLVVAAALIFMIGILPTSGIIPFDFQDWSTVADRYLYLSMLGTALAFAYYVQQRWDLRISKLIIITLLIIWVNLTASQIPNWKNHLSLWTDVVRKNPHQYNALNNLGIAHRGRGQYEKALADFNQAIELFPDNVGAYVNRGGTFQKLGRYDQALADFNQAIKLFPDNVGAYVNRGGIFQKLGRYEQALADFNTAIEIDSGYANAYNFRGDIFQELGQYEKALADFNKAIEIDTLFADAYNNRGVANFKKVEYQQAIRDFTRALELNRDPRTYRNRVLTYYAMKEFSKAWLDIQAMKTLGYPVDPTLVQELEMILTGKEN